MGGGGQRKKNPVCHLTKRNDHNHKEKSGKKNSIQVQVETKHFSLMEMNGEKKKWKNINLLAFLSINQLNTIHLKKRIRRH